MAQRNVGQRGRYRTDPALNSEATQHGGLAHFRSTLNLVEEHLQGPRGHVMPALSLSPAGEDVVCFRFIRDRRRYLVHVLPYRERRDGYPRQRTAALEFRCLPPGHRDTEAQNSSNDTSSVSL
jgi:hypothetical protein